MNDCQIDVKTITRTQAQCLIRKSVKFISRKKFSLNIQWKYAGNIWICKLKSLEPIHLSIDDKAFLQYQVNFNDTKYYEGSIIWKNRKAVDKFILCREKQRVLRIVFQCLVNKIFIELDATNSVVDISVPWTTLIYHECLFRANAK